MTRLTLLALALLVVFATDTHANAQVEETTNIITGVMSQVLDVIVQFIGAIIDEIVRGIKEIF